MKTFRTRKKLFVWVAVVALVAMGVAMTACAPKANPGNPTPERVAPATVPEADEFGVVSSEAWGEIYPNQYRTYLDNNMNVPPQPEYSEKTAENPDTTTPHVDEYAEYTAYDADNPKNKLDYLEINPEIKILGKGYGYAKYYTEPAGHTYALWSNRTNGRISDKSKAQCITCKSAQFLNDVQGYTDAKGKSVAAQIAWTDPFMETIAKYNDNITCQNCHQADNPAELRPLRNDWIRAMGEDADKASKEGQVCGQCHCDYSMDATWDKDGEPTSPYYGGLDSMVPDKAMEFYDEYDFADWTYASTGAKMLAVRHAEYEFCYGGEGNHMTNLGYDCSDCHMAVEVDENGEAYHSHYWNTPLENEELIKNDCSKCHKDIKAEVAAWQEDIDGRTHELGLRAADFIKNFETKVATEQDDPNNPGEKALLFDAEFAKKNGIEGETLERLQWIQRASAYYWNFIAAENSEGAHNPTLYNYCIDKGNELLDEGDKLLGMTSEPKELPAEQSAGGVS